LWQEKNISVTKKAQGTPFGRGAPHRDPEAVSRILFSHQHCCQRWCGRSFLCDPSNWRRNPPA